MKKINKKLFLINGISFLLGFSQAFFIYVMSTYLKLASGLENVGFFYFFSYLSVFFIFLNLHKIIKRFGKEDVFHLALIFKIISVCFLSVVSPSLWGVFWVIVYIISGNVEWVSVDIILESYSSDDISGRIRGKYLTIMNAGILLGPFLSAFVLDKYDFNGLFLALIFFNVAISAIAIVGIKKIEKEKKKTKYCFEKNTFSLARKFLTRRNVRKIYYISFMLEFFYALTIIFVPLHLQNMGLTLKEIGSIFTIMLLPFIFIQYPIGFWADKKLGEKEMLIFGILIMAFSGLGIFFFSSREVFWWGIILFSGRFGAAIVEILRDSYFYKRIDSYDVDMINFFRTSKSLAYIFSSSIAGFVLLIFPLKSVFILLGIVSFSALWSAFRLEDNKCEKELIAKKKKMDLSYDKY